MFLSDPLSSDPPICAWVSQLVSSLFVFWIKGYMRVLSLLCELQALCIQFSIISTSVNYLVKSKYKLLVTQMDKICTHKHTQTHTHISSLAKSSWLGKHHAGAGGYHSQKSVLLNPYPTAFPYGNGMVLHLYQQQESSTTKTVHKVINKGLKTYV